MNNILEIVNNISNVAVAKKMLISTAESCTGGLISKYLTDLDGSSLFFDSSIVVYSNASKRISRRCSQRDHISIWY